MIDAQALWGQWLDLVIGAWRAACWVALAVVAVAVIVEWLG